jgi:hypothetical protein
MTTKITMSEAVKSYQITSSQGQDMNVYTADSASEALDAMARDAGYADAAAAAREVGPFEGTIVDVEP